MPADDSRQRTFTGNLNIYYDAVIASIRDAESILIFGPGEAKGEPKKRLKKSNLDGRIVDIGTIDKMTDRQIAAKVNSTFGKRALGPRTRHAIEVTQMKVKSKDPGNPLNAKGGVTHRSAFSVLSRL